MGFAVTSWATLCKLPGLRKLHSAHVNRDDAVRLKGLL